MGNAIPRIRTMGIRLLARAGAGLVAGLGIVWGRRARLIMIALIISFARMGNVRIRE